MKSWKVWQYWDSICLRHWCWLIPLGLSGLAVCASFLPSYLAFCTHLATSPINIWGCDLWWGAFFSDLPGRTTFLNFLSVVNWHFHKIPNSWKWINRKKKFKARYIKYKPQCLISFNGHKIILANRYVSVTTPICNCSVHKSPESLTWGALV